MPDTKITGLTAYSTPSASDVWPIVDVSDTTMSPSGTDKQITIPQLLASGVAPLFALTPASAPGAPATAMAWYDSTQQCWAIYDGMVAYLPRLIYSQVTDVTIAASGNSSIFSTSGAPGGIALAAGYLNVVGRSVVLTVLGYGTTPASGMGATFAFAKLGSNVIATAVNGNLVASKTNLAWRLDLVITTKAIGANGKLDIGGTWTSSQTGSAGLFVNNMGLVNGTVAGTQAAATQVTLDLTQAYTLDVQFNFSAATNSFVVTNVTVEVKG